MGWGVESGDVIGTHYFVNSHIIYKTKNQNSIYYTKKRDGNVTNVPEMEDTISHDGVDVDVMLPASKLHQYANMECNN